MNSTLWLVASALFTFLLPQPIAPERRALPAEFIVWNVGQGLWTTLVADDHCVHFDAGGERAPWKAISSSCRQSENVLNFSHWDFDHINFIPRLMRKFRSVCLRTAPGGEPTPRKMRLFNFLERCPTVESFETRLIQGEFQGQGANARSHVFLTSASPASSRTAKILIPGDSPSREEKKWVRMLLDQTVWLFILGHHGSRTSTSETLVRRLPFVHMAVASSRMAKYGHPHPNVVRRLKLHGIALLKTEDWGSLRFEIPKAPYARRTRSAELNESRVYIQDPGCERRVRKSRCRRKRSAL